MVWPMNSVWALNPDAEVYLQELVKQGLSAGEVADKLTARFAVTFGRSQVMGKLKRMRLSLRRAEVMAEKRANPPPPPPPKPQPTRKISHFNGLIKRQPHEPSFPPIPPPLSEHPGYPFAKVPVGGCMYEITASDTPAKDFRFCGQQRAPGEPYCEHHFGLTLSPANYKLRIRVR
jgi:hypothetical protein